MVAVSTGSRRRKRITSTAVAAIVSVSLVGGCSQAISGIPTTLGSYSTTEVAGLPATNGPSGPKDGAPESKLRVAGTDHGEMDGLARDAVDDVQTYWKEAFPETFDDADFKPVKRLVSFDSRGRGTDLCGTNTARLANAFYCPPEDTIAWDRAELLPKLDKSFGPMAVVTVIAHEMGHAVQHRAKTAKADDPVIVLEQQADCFTGAYYRHVAEGSSEHFRLSTGDGLNQVMSVLNYVRDVPGHSDFTGNDAHGSAFDRITAFQHGFSSGPRRCAEMDADEVKERTTQFQFWKDEQESDLPVSEKHLAAVERSLRQVFHDSGAEPPSIRTGTTGCDNTSTTSPATYCPESNAVSLDLDELQEIAEAPEKGGKGYGDFAAYAQVASRYVLSVQDAAGMSLDDDAAGLRTACLVGSWSGLLVEDPIGRRNPVGKLRVAPGDIDEGVAAMLGEDSLIAANVRGEQVPAGFARVEAFRIGFQTGSGQCTTKYSG
ncbi:neutral zinc metallopeptidase [Parasphingorhabdus pacifica]